MLSRLKFEIDHVIDLMLSKIPQEMWTSESTTFFDPSMGGGQIVNAIEKKLKEYGHSNKNIAQRVAGSELNTMRINYAVNKNKLLGSYTAEIDETKTYDVIVSLPMFNISSEGGQNKVYNQYSKTSLNMLSNDGKLLFVTPVSVLKKSKRFSLRGQPNLKLIDFTIGKRELLNKKDICFWMIDKTFQGKVTVKDSDGESLQDNNNIVDYSIHDREFVKLYYALKQATDKPNKRMFKQNNFGPAMAKQKSQEHKYPLYKINKEGAEEITFWSSRKPYDHQKTKFTVCMTKALQNSIYVSQKDFDLAYMTTEASESEIESIKSFINTEYFIEHSTKWKKLDGYGYNYALKYLPPFDTTKNWDNKSVKNFLESFMVDNCAS